jgi:hypothetical protein
LTRTFERNDPMLKRNSSDSSSRRPIGLETLERRLALCTGVGCYAIFVNVVDVTPDPRTTSVPAIEVKFTRPIVASSFDYQDLTLTRNGGTNLITSGVAVSQVDTLIYRVSGLTQATANDGEYLFTVLPSGNQGQDRYRVLSGASDAWTKSTTVRNWVAVGPYAHPASATAIREPAGSEVQAVLDQAMGTVQSDEGIV